MTDLVGLFPRHIRPEAKTTEMGLGVEHLRVSPCQEAGQGLLRRRLHTALG